MFLSIAQFASDTNDEYGSKLFGDSMFAFLRGESRIFLHQFLGMDEMDVMWQKWFDLRIHFAYHIFGTSHGRVDTGYNLFKEIYRALFGGNRSFPVPLVYIEGMEIAQFFIGSDRIHVRIDAISRFNVVYARVQPEHKVRIVNAWKANGYISAMTGDGVNDAPSIKSADIGVGMGITGTDVTKNVADMVLADDNFATIVSAVGEGRRIYDNIRKAIQFLLASNMSEVLGVFFATLMGFVLLNPVHLLFINLVTDCFPALALGMEDAEPDTMRRPPRDSKDGIFSGGLGVDVVYQGVLVTVITLAAYLIGSYFEFGKDFFNALREAGESGHGMTMAFLTMSMCEIFHSFNLRSQRKSVFSLKTHNKVLWAAMFGSLLLTTAVLEIPFLANAFGFTMIGWTEYGISIGLAILVIPVVETVKFFQRKLSK